MPWVAAVIGGAVTLIGGAMQADQNRKAAHGVQDFAALQTNTAYQRREKDLISAGYSPMLAYQSGGAQSAPGYSYQVGNYGAEAVQAASGAYSSAVHAKEVNAAIDKMMTEIRNIDSDTKLKEMQAKLTALDASKLAQLIPIIVRGEKALLARKEVGESALEHMEAQQVEFWEWLAEQGHSLGGKAADAADWINQMLKSAKEVWNAPFGHLK